jgi:hypothetical protein
MRIVSVIAILGLACAETQQPIMSLEKITTVLSATKDLTIDSVKFVSFKIEEALPEPHNDTYGKFVAHADEYTTMVGDMYRRSVVKPAVDVVYRTVFGLITKTYERLNNFNHMYLDALVQEFEHKFPTSRGLLGRELVDRVLTITWVYWSIKCALKLMCRKCSSKKCKKI